MGLISLPPSLRPNALISPQTCHPYSSWSSHTLGCLVLDKLKFIPNSPKWRPEESGDTIWHLSKLPFEGLTRGWSLLPEASSWAPGSMDSRCSWLTWSSGLFTPVLTGIIWATLLQLWHCSWVSLDFPCSFPALPTFRTKAHQASFQASEMGWEMREKKNPRKKSPQEMVLHITS